MIKQPNLTVSGYRGIWGESLTHKIVENYTKSFIKFVKENTKEKPIILIGRDGRESGKEIKETIIKTLGGLDIIFIDGDILPTPTVLFAVKKHKYDGAIIITASHNPREYNGLKFVTSKALFADEKEVEEIKKNYEKLVVREKFSFGSLFSSAQIFSCWKIFLLAPSRCARLPKKTSSQSNFPQEHADQILQNIEVELIRSKKWRVAVDMINASACVVDPYLFEKLGVELVPLNNIPNGIFGHKPEPLRENLEEIGKLVKEKKCDLGFAHDPDADRLVIIDENGEVVFEEYTLAFGVESIMSRPENIGKNVVINMSSSKMSEDIAEKYNGKCFRTKVGEANVVAGIEEHNAVIGGEGGGGVIYPTINMARDSFVSLALILELLAKRNKTVSECIENLPKYEMLKDKISINEDLEKIYKKIKNNFPNEKVNELDGLRLDFSDNSWVHIRPSNTEPIVRLIGEAKTKERIESIFEEIKKII